MLVVKKRMCTIKQFGKRDNARQKPLRHHIIILNINLRNLIKNVFNIDLHHNLVRVQVEEGLDAKMNGFTTSKGRYSKLKGGRCSWNGPWSCRTMEWLIKKKNTSPTGQKPLVPFTITNNLLAPSTKTIDLKITPRAITITIWNNSENLKDGSSSMRWHAPKSRGETHLRVSQSQVAESWDSEARSRLPTLERGRGLSWEPRD
jgi:hypothetical protein